MKTQILRLEAEDDHHSAREKLRWAKAARVVLIWPGRGRSLVRRLDLILLQRQAEALGIQLGLISFDPEVLAHAEELGIPVFQSIEHIDQETWERPRRARRENFLRLKKTQRPNLGSLPRSGRTSRSLPSWARAACFILPILLTLGAIAASYPSATIVIEPATTVERHTYEVVVDDASVALSGLELKAMSVEVEGVLRIPTSGEASAPDGIASGEVLLTNLTAEALVLPAGTRLQALKASNPPYETTDTVELPAGAARSISIRALEPGLAANLESGATWALEGDFGLLIDVQNEEPISGGSVAMRRAVSPSDLIEARLQLQEQLRTEAQGIIEQSLTPDQLLVPGSVHMQRTLASTQDLNAGALGDSVEVSLSIAFEATLVNAAQLRQTLEDHFRDDLVQGRSYQPGSLSIENLGLAADADGSQVLTSSIVANTLLDVDRSSLARRLRGARRAELDQTVRQVSADLSVGSLEIRPGWLPFLPLFEYQITVAFPWEPSA